MTSPGELVYYDRCGGILQTFFPFDNPHDAGIGVVVSDVKSYQNEAGDDVYWVEILDEDGTRKDIALDYLRSIKEAV